VLNIIDLAGSERLAQGQAELGPNGSEKVKVHPHPVRGRSVGARWGMVVGVWCPQNTFFLILNFFKFLEYITVDEDVFFVLGAPQGTPSFHKNPPKHFFPKKNLYII